MKEAKEKKLPAPAQSAYLKLTEDGIKTALIEARGDIFIASQILGVTPVRLNGAIRASETLSLVRQVSSKKDLDEGQLREEVESRIVSYRIVGLDALADLALMPIDANSAQNQVKLAAAARLAGAVEHSGGESGELAETLRQLNSQYHESAPHIRVVRQTLIEVSPSSVERNVTNEK